MTTVSGGSPPLQNWLQNNPNATINDAITEAKRTAEDGQEGGPDGLSQNEITTLEEHFEINIIDANEIGEFAARVQQNDPGFEPISSHVIISRIREGNEGEEAHGPTELSRDNLEIAQDPVVTEETTLQEQIENDPRLTQMRDNPTDYIDPSSGYQVGENTVTLENAILDDFADVRGVFDDANQLLETINRAYPDNQLNAEDAEFLFNMIENGGPDPSEADVENLQRTMSKISGSYRDLVAQNGDNGGFDGLYGFATTEQIRNLNADVLENVEPQVDEFSVVNFETVTQPPPDVFSDYDEVMIVMDKSPSMRGERRAIAGQVQETMANSEAGTEFGLVFFEDTNQVSMKSRLGGDREGIIDDLVNSRSTRKSPDESGFNGALKALNSGGFSSPAREPDARRLVRVYTDEPEHDATPEKLAELQQRSEEMGIDMEFVYSYKENGVDHFFSFNIDEITPDMMNKFGTINFKSLYLEGRIGRPVDNL